ncbi:MAG: glycosyltransferase [Planctomycetota bacterium]
MTLLRVFAGAVAVVILAALLTPVGLALAVVLLLGNLVTVRRRLGGVVATKPDRDTSAACIMVLNWNGRAFLERLLPSLDAAIAHDGGAHEIIVVDNGSADDSLAFVRRQHPHVRIVAHGRNEKFVRGYNLALGATSKDVIVLLNNDMVVDPGFLRPLLRGLAQDPHAFAVSARIDLEDEDKRGLETGRTAGRWAIGLFKLAHLPWPEGADGVWPCLWAGGGSSAVDRRALLQLGGFETLFDPYYFEDASLSYQAWRHGLNVLAAPASRVVHSHRGSSSRLRPIALARVQRRNAHLFTWRSFDDSRMTLAATTLLPLSAVRVALHGGFAGAARRSLIELLGLGSALWRLPAALRARLRTRRTAPRTDRDVLALAHSRHRCERAQAQHVAPEDRLRLLMLLARVPRRDADGSWVQFELLRQLGRRHHVTVLALAETPAMAAKAEELAPHVARVETLLLTRDPARVDLWHQDPAGFRRDYSDAGIRRRVAEVLATTAFDVVQVDYVEMAYVCEGLLDDLASVHVVHEPLAQAAWTQKGGPLARAHERARAVNMERRLLRPFARLVCMTEADADTLRRSHPRFSPVVVTNGIDAERLAPQPPSTSPTLLFVGSYAHDPNVDAAEFAARQVLPQVRAAIKDARLRLVGHDPQRRLASLAALPGVDVCGFVADLEAEVREAACFLAPLRHGGGMRSKILEALAWGRPVVGTPLALTGIAGKPAEHYVVATDAAALATGCVRILADAAERTRLGRAGRALVEQHHTSVAMAAKYEAVYRDVLVTRRPTP